MMTDSRVSEQTYRYFEQEATELLQTMGDELQDLRSDFSPQKVHTLMRAAHTLKGASASVGLDAVTKTTHSLESIFKALCHQDTDVSVEMERLIFDGYDCLQLLMSAQLEGSKVDESDILDRMAAVVSQLQAMLGARFGQEGHIPTSSELGFDLTQSIFEVGVSQRLTLLSEALEEPDLAALSDLLKSQAEVFIGLAESLDLPGFQEIAQITLDGLTEHPERTLAIAQAALENFCAAKADVLGGDRTQGGVPSAALQQLCGFSSRQALLEKADAQARKKRKGSWIKRPWQLLTHPIGKSAQSEQPRDHSVGQLSQPIASVEDAADSDEHENVATSTEPVIAEVESSAIQLEDSEMEDSSPFAGDPSLFTDDLPALNLPASERNSSSRQKQPRQPGNIPADTSASSSRRITTRVSAQHLQQLSQAMGELLTQQNRQTLYNEQLSALVKKLSNRILQQQRQLNQYRDRTVIQASFARASSDHLQAKPTPAASSNAISYAQFDTLELDQYNDIQLLVQSCLEESIQQSESVDAIELFVKRSEQALDRQKRLLANTRETLLTARMVPLRQVFQRLPAAVSRLQAQFCGEYGKQVEVVIEGGEFLVDRAIVDQLYEPLLHLVRNAFDHGIEFPEERIDQNKPAAGRITIAGAQQGRYVVITIKDDGQGLDLEIIRTKAIESQLITVAEAATLTLSQTTDLLFEAGFSTAGDIDSISGRGVGLDAVRARVRSLQGETAVSYVPAVSTCFTLKIPTHTSIAKMLLCRVKDRTYALMTEAIEHILRPTLEQMWVWEGGKTLTWQTSEQEYLIPVSTLDRVLPHTSSLPEHRTPLTADTHSGISSPLVLLRHGDTLVGLEVDELLGEQELVISPLSTTLSPPDYLYGSSVLPNGQLTLVLDSTVLAKVVSTQHRQQKGDDASANASNRHSSQIASASQKPVFAKKLILTVDDSITVRDALADALQRVNYQVIQAKDGAEALQQLARYPDVQAILCDIEMPGMNGFEFLKVRQQRPEIASIPTIMLTSRAGTKHRSLTENLGATAYLTKPYLTPQLLQTVAEAIESQFQTLPQVSPQASLSTVGANTVGASAVRASAVRASTAGAPL